MKSFIDSNGADARQGGMRLSYSSMKMGSANVPITLDREELDGFSYRNRGFEICSRQRIDIRNDC